MGADWDRMVLAGDEEGMFGKFHDFHQSVFVIDGADDQPCVFQFVAVGRVEFVPVAVAFRDAVLAVKLVRQRSAGSGPCRRPGAWWLPWLGCLFVLPGG